jgi:hypothetical protein
MDEKIEMADSDVIVADALLRCSDILNVPVCSVISPRPILRFAAA